MGGFFIIVLSKGARKPWKLKKGKMQKLRFGWPVKFEMLDSS